MKYAVFSDIHSNLEAYEAVLAEISGEGVKGYYCCGDIVGYGADPVECIKKTFQINPETVAGNHDWGAVGLTDIENFSPHAKSAVTWTGEALGEEEKEYLKALRLLKKNDFLLVHGSPRRPEEFDYIFGLNQAYGAFLQMEEDDIGLCFAGHTHAAGVFIKEANGGMFYNSSPEVTVEDGKKYIVNVGSIGQPRDGDPRAAYCIYDAGRKLIQIKRVRYDIEKAKDKIINAGLPRVLGERLVLGK